MISRSQMRRQLRANGGIMNARQGYGLGSWVKEKIRKLIPNELAEVAVKAAPFVAPFNPAIAGLMSGVGSFDKTGRVGDSLKKGAMNYAGGQAARYLGGADFQGSPFSTDGGAFRGGLEGLKGGFSSPLGTDTGFKLGTEATPSTTSEGNLNALAEGQTGAKETSEILSNAKNKPTNFKDVFQNKVSEFSSGLFEGVPLLGELPPLVQQQILVGGVTSAATYIYEAFIMEEPPQDENETMEEYLARRKENVGKKMRTYMDNYMAFDAEYSALDDAGKDAVVERYNKNMGGLMRQNYQTGGITMSNSLAQNIAQNKANQRARAQELEQARSRIPGYVAAEKVSAPTPAPMIEEIQETIQPDRPTIDMPIANRPMPFPDMSRPMPRPMPGGPVGQPGSGIGGSLTPLLPMPRPGPGIDGNPFDKFLKGDGNNGSLPTPPRPDPRGPGSEDIMSGFEEFYNENYGQGTASTADVRTYKLPNGEIVEGSSTSMGQTNAYLKSIGQPPATAVNLSSAGLPGLQQNPGGPNDPTNRRTLQQEAADEKKYGTTADGKTVHPSNGRGMYINLLDVVKYDQPNVKLTGNETLAELERLAYPQYFNPDGTMKPEKAKGGLMGSNRIGFGNGSGGSIITLMDGTIVQIPKGSYTSSGGLKDIIYSSSKGDLLREEIIRKLSFAKGGRVGLANGSGIEMAIEENKNLEEGMTGFKRMTDFLNKKNDERAIKNAPEGVLMDSPLERKESLIEALKNAGEGTPQDGGAYSLNSDAYSNTIVFDDGTVYYKDTGEFYHDDLGEVTGPGLGAKPIPKTMGAANGGLMRLGYMIGGEAKQMEAGAPPIMYSGNMDPNAPNEQAGLPSVPGPIRMAEDGPEFDMRENGGFQPLGRQEGKDDVPAILAKNEFVMTADAVRAAGGGSIQKGAQKMYDTMKKLESRVS